ncbi:hypothetical protein [Achromobacter aloeverae]
MSFFQNLTSSFKTRRGLQRGFLSILPGISQDLRSFVATFEIPYVQRVSVGIQAVTPEQAKQLLIRAFTNGSLLKDTPSMPLLETVFEPSQDTAQMPPAHVAEVDDFPEQDASVLQMKCLNSSSAMLALCRHFNELLVEADDGRDDPYRTIQVSSSTADRLHNLMRGLADF